MGWDSIGRDGMGRDGTDRDGTGLVVQMLVYPDCAAARHAADLMAAADVPLAPGASRVTRLVDNGAKGCAADVVVQGLATDGP